MKKIVLMLSVAFSVISYSQNVQRDVLFTIDGTKYYTDDFARIYKKNLDLVKDESQKDLNTYLDLYIGYKLKVAKANKLGLQNGAQYLDELKSYRNQLAKNYITDSKVTNELVQEAYNRSQREINASHILILCDENAEPADTLKAFNKITAIKKRIENGENFDAVAKTTSEDPSAKDNSGNLGWFSVFRMVYPFETAAYKTPVGKVSNPVRSRFGYHLVKVNDARPNRGDIQVAHIMIMKAKDSADAEKPKKTIFEIYQKLQQGEKFEELAKQFSEDKSSATKGGVLNRFSSGMLSSEEFENTAYGLTKEHPVSEPVKTAYGWHIIKLMEKFPPKSLEESKKELEERISRDERSRLISNSLTDKLKKKYTVKTDAKMYDKAKSMVFDNVYEGKWDVPTDMKPYETTMLTVQDRSVSAADFLKYVKDNQKAKSGIKPVGKMVDALYDKYKDDEINKYYNDNLEKEFPEFASVVEEYRDGLLIFDLMDKEIWQRSKKDSLGLENFYNNLKEKPQWKTRAQAIILSSVKEDVTKKALAMLKKGKSIQEIKDKFNTKDKVDIMVSESFYEEGDSALPKDTKMVVGTSDVMKQGDYYYAVKIDKILPAGNKSLDECKGKIVNDYQQYLEQNWVNELKKEFTIDVDKNTFEKVKASLKK